MAILVFGKLHHPLVLLYVHIVGKTSHNYFRKNVLQQCPAGCVGFWQRVPAVANQQKSSHVKLTGF